MRANEILWIGDSWVRVPNDLQSARVRDLAREAGAKWPEDEESYTVLAEAAASMADVAEQYEARQARTPKVKVLIMDGGTWDPIQASLFAGDIDAAARDAIATFRQFLAKVGDDGSVEHIIYFLVPELELIPGVIGAMRPELQQACASSRVPCHFLDLEEHWATGYTDPANRIQASEEGARVIAQEIWAIMQEHCIAQ